MAASVAAAAAVVACQATEVATALGALGVALVVDLDSVEAWEVASAMETETWETTVSTKPSLITWLIASPMLKRMHVDLSPIGLYTIWIFSIPIP